MTMTKFTQQPRKTTKITRSGLGQQVRQIIDGMSETKRFTLLTTANPPAAAGTVINLTNGVVQGDDISQRSGDQIKMRKQILRMRFSAAVNSQSVRFILFKDNTNRGTTPAVLEVLNAANVVSQYNTTNLQQHRFTVLSDVTLNCSINGEVIKERSFTTASKYPVYYNGATAVAASNGPGSTFCLVIGELATGVWDLGYELHYKDL